MEGPTSTTLGVHKKTTTQIALTLLKILMKNLTMVTGSFLKMHYLCICLCYGQWIISIILFHYSLHPFILCLEKESGVFIKGQAPGKFTSCEDHFARLSKPVAVLLKTLMKPLR